MVPCPDARAAVFGHSGQSYNLMIHLVSAPQTLHCTVVFSYNLHCADSGGAGRDFGKGIVTLLHEAGLSEEVAGL